MRPVLPAKHPATMRSRKPLSPYKAAAMVRERLKLGERLENVSTGVEGASRTPT